MSRKNPVLGEKHCTASIIIHTQESPIRVLLVHHKKIQKWLPPGGHVENHENPYETAIREAYEETGIDIKEFLEPEKCLDDRAVLLPLPNFFIEEKIEATASEPEHFHLDMMYIVAVPHQRILKQEKESNDAKWFELEEINSLQTFDNVKMLLKRIFCNA